MVETESKPWIPSRRALTASGAGLVLVYAPDPSTAPPSYALGPTTTYVGRSPPDAGLMVTDAAVSRVHARIELAADGFLLTDLNSRNGIVVNGRLVLAATLHTGDLVQIGSVIYKFVQTGIDDYADHGIVLEPAAVKRQLGLVGGASVGRILAELRRVAKTDLSMLLLGETGTGKEVVARALHDASGRTGQFRALNCAAIPENLVESELFGYRKGRVHGGRAKPPRPRAVGQRRHAAARRNRRHASRGAGEALAPPRHRRGGVHRRRDRRSRRPPGRLRDPLEPAHARRAGALPRGPLRPHQRVHVAAPSAPRPEGRRRAPGSPLPRRRGRRRRAPNGRLHARRLPLRLAVQRS
ncbi:MAG: sigma 54-interacting transcriptional regulator [Myxococcales bacterium]|nr:sigma 54-interacting transcriptional regulator [Myxococcales bacterium]